VQVAGTFLDGFPSSRIIGPSGSGPAGSRFPGKGIILLLQGKFGLQPALLVIGNGQKIVLAVVILMLSSVNVKHPPIIRMIGFAVLDSLNPSCFSNRVNFFPTKVLALIFAIFSAGLHN
jgi:hypothetical protein